MREIEQLIKMANQIADNLAFHEDAVERTADHMKRFWAPSMRQQLIAHGAEGGDGLNPAVRLALQRLAES
jgi:formate dehydrogenase subunit delta